MTRIARAPIGYADALSIVQSQSKRLARRSCAVERAIGRVLAEPVASRVDLPPFDNSAMDGFAVGVGADGADAGTIFEVTDWLAAGDPARAGHGACEIMTGACMPAGLDSVVPIEQVEVTEHDAAGRPRRIRLAVAAVAARHVRRRGEDVAAGAPVLQAGELLMPQQAMLLAALGVARVSVTRQPRVALICTGRELVDDARRPLASGEIRNSNGPFLAARVVAAGAELVQRATIADEPAAFVAALEDAARVRADIVISTGAVSMGRHDFVPDALRSAGAELLFHKVGIRPGKPLLFARFPDGMLHFGLPGNPVAAAVGLRFFVEPALRVLLGMAPERSLRVPLAAPLRTHAGMTSFLKGNMHADEGGQLRALALPGQESFRIRPLIDANVWLVAGGDLPERGIGAHVDVFGLGHLAPAHPLALAAN